MAKTFVLMHGAWHGGWCWARVAEPLRVRGHVVTTPTQTGLGERRHLLSAEIGLQTFIDDLVNHLLSEDLTDVTLVGHSFGGNALSGAAEAVPERIAELVYLDCTILRSGENMADTLAPGALAERVRAAAEHGNDIAVPPPPVEVFGVTDPSDVAWTQPRLTPHPIATMLDPLPIKGTPANGLPARYIACAEPRYHAEDRVHAWSQEFGWPVDQIQTGHDAMVTAPSALVDLLDR